MTELKRPDYHSFSYDFMNFVQERIIPGLSQSPEYDEYDAFIYEAEGIKNEVFKRLGSSSEDWDKLERMATVYVAAGNIHARAAYIQGWRDSKEISKMLQGSDNTTAK